MGTPGNVHWYEGLFLQPHHLQTMQRHQVEGAMGDRSLAWPHPYGVIDSAYSADALENHLVQFDRLVAVMPSGLLVSYPDHADVPTVDFREAFDEGQESLTVRLGVPLWQSERANAVSEDVEAAWRQKRLYRIVETDRRDENTGENPQPMKIRRMNARLLLPGDDEADVETLPVLRIVHGAGAQVGSPRQDPLYVPPCLRLRGSRALYALARDVANQVEASRKELCVQMNSQGFQVDHMRGAQFEELARLRTLSRFSARLLTLIEAPNLHPFWLYLEFRDLLAELAALYPESDLFDAAPYHHDNLTVSFHDLTERIRPLLKGAVKPRSRAIPFEEDADLLVATLTPEDVTDSGSFYLGIHTRQEVRALAQLVEDGDRFKLMARSQANLAVFGIPLQWENQPPIELPVEMGLHFFRLKVERNPRIWQRIQDERTVAIPPWQGKDAADYRLALYHVVPRGETGP